MTTPPLQPGQYWRTRSGEIVYVDSVLPEWACISLPVIVISKHEKVGHKVDFYHRNGCHFVNGESPHDLVTHLPDCDSMDWVPPKYPQWRVRDDKYGYLFKASEDTPWVRFNKHGASVPDRECLCIDEWRIATQEEAESRVQKPVPTLQKKYYKSHLDDFGYFRVDSNESYSWITPDGREVKQCGYPDILKKHPFVEITKEEAETRVKKSDAPETVIEINDSVLSMLNTPTALLINGEIAGLITEVEFGLMNDEIRQKTPVARQYLGVSVSPPEILKPPIQTTEHPDDWVVQDRVPDRPDVDEWRWVYSSGNESGWFPTRKNNAVFNMHGYKDEDGDVFEVRCRRKDLPPVTDPPQQPKPPSHHTAPEVWSLIEDADRENICTYQEQRPSFTPIQLLIRICSAQQSMLSELSAQVDALRSQITSGGEKCQKE